MIYTVSDIHGCYNKYRKLLKKINFGPDDTLYVLGDVIDRGPDGFKILLDMARRSNVINLMGNHEAMAVQALSHILCVVQQGSGSALSEEAEEDVGLWFYKFGERLGGGSGLPGDYSSPSRFVRLAFMKEFVVPGKDEPEGVSRMFRAFAPVDIPEGLAKADPDYDMYEQTLCTSVMCAESGAYYFAPAWNRRISAVRLPAQGNEIQYFDLGDCQDIDWRN